MAATKGKAATKARTVRRFSTDDDRWAAVVSRGVTVRGRERLIPYVGLQARYTQFEFRGVQRDDFSLPIRIGCQFPIVQGFRVSGEAQLRIGDDIDDHDALGVGVEFDI